MKTPTYKEIESLLKDVRIREGFVHCIFRCPLTHRQVVSRAIIKRGITDDDKNLLGEHDNISINLIKQSIKEEIEYKINVMANSKEEDAELTDLGDFEEEEVKFAILRCFRLSERFAWNEEKQCWSLKGATPEYMSEFDKQLLKAPVKTIHDRKVLARFLIDLAYADDNFDDEEEIFLNGFIHPELGDIESLREEAIPTKEQLEELSDPGIRDTIYMLAWTIAMCDSALKTPELLKLIEFRKLLGIFLEHADVLKDFAASYVIEKAVERYILDGTWSRESRKQVIQIGTDIGITSTNSEIVIEVFLNKFDI